MKIISKHRLSAIASLFIVIALIACTGTAAFSQSNKLTGNQNVFSWKVALKTTISQPMNIAGFFDTSSGITVGPDGEIHYTTDKGKTWPRAKNVSMCRFGLEILSKNVAISCGNGKMIRKTSDGGKSWFALSDNNCVAKFISFIDEKTGFVASGLQLDATYDSGKTWKGIKLPQNIDEIAAISFNSAKEGYLLDVKGNLFVTKNGCTSWDKKKVPIKGNITSATAANAIISFYDANHGLMIGVLENGQIASFKTENGGKAWSQMKLPQEVKSDYGFTIFMSHSKKIITMTDGLGITYVLQRQG